MRRIPGSSLKKTPRQKRSLQTIEFILEAATYILEREGTHRATTNRIAERAGVNIASLYQYFDDKDAILKTLVLFKAEQHMAMLERILEDLAPLETVDLIKMIASRVRTEVLEAPEALRQLLMLTPALGQMEQIKALRRQATELIASEMTKRTKVSPEIALQGAFVLLHAVFGVIYGFLYNNTPNLCGSDLELIIERMILCHMGAFSPPVTPNSSAQ